MATPPTTPLHPAPGDPGALPKDPLRVACSSRRIDELCGYVEFYQDLINADVPLIFLEPLGKKPAKGSVRASLSLEQGFEVPIEGQDGFLESAAHAFWMTLEREVDGHGQGGADRVAWLRQEQLPKAGDIRFGKVELLLGLSGRLSCREAWLLGRGGGCQAFAAHLAALRRFWRRGVTDHGMGHRTDQPEDIQASIFGVITQYLMQYTRQYVMRIKFRLLRFVLRSELRGFRRTEALSSSRWGAGFVNWCASEQT